MNKLTQEEFLARAKAVFGELYDYSQTKYVLNKTKIKIICRVHGIFEQSPNNHLNRQGCQKCALEIKGRNYSIKTLGFAQGDTEAFIEKSKQIHGEDRFSYEKTIYTKMMEPVVVTCMKHGDVRVSAQNHLSGGSCRKCASEARIKTKEEFIDSARKRHGEFYSYELVQYVHGEVGVEIVCPKHGSFFQKPKTHLNGSGCQKCRKSKSVLEIEKILDFNQIAYKCEKTFDSCKNPETGKALRFDFYLPDYNLLIEYDGAHHFKEIEFWSEIPRNAARKLAESKRRDEYKNRWAIESKITLFRLNYKQNRLIERKLVKFFKTNYKIKLKYITQDKESK